MKLSSLSRLRLILLFFCISVVFSLNLFQSVAGEEAQDTSNNQPIIRIFRIKNPDLDKAKEKINQLLSKDGKAGANLDMLSVMRSGEEINFLVVKDIPAKLEEISRAIAELEKKSSPVLVSLDFDDVALSQVLATIARTADLNIVGGEGVAQKVNIHLKNISFDDLFDTVLKSTDYTYIKEGNVLRIIPKADLPLTTEVFELQYISAAQVTDALNSLLTTKGSLKSVSKFNEGKYSNFLIATDVPRSLETIREVIKKLDKKLRQVMIEVKFCEITYDKDDELGVEYIIKASLTGAKGPTTFPLNWKGLNLPQPPQTITATTGAITNGTFSFADFSATLHALDTENKVKLIASPRIATRDGQEAQILIGDKVPIPLYERDNETGTMEVTGYQDQDIGIVLKVKPVINNDNTIDLMVHQEVSEQTGSTGPNNERPIVSTREITTAFIVESGKTVAVGGLMKQKWDNTATRIPILGRIPFLGRLFTYNDDVEQSTQLVVFITPQLIDEATSSEDTNLTLNKMMR